MSISIVHPYYNHRETFQYQLNQWLQFSSSVRKRIEIIVVDDGSPEYPCILQDHLRTAISKSVVPLDLKILRINENILWNTAGAANLGVHCAKYDWIMHVDFDLGVNRENAEKFLKLDLSDPKVVYWPRTWHMSSRGYHKPGWPHGNSYLMNKSTFWEAGGYDEDFSGMWGCQDSLFHQYSCKKLDLKKVVLEDVFLERMVRCKDRTVQNVPRERTSQRNWQLLYAKMNESIPQSTDHLRFTWKQVYP